MSESRPEPEEAARHAANRALIERYFRLLTTGDPAIADLLADDIVWRVPRSSPMRGPFEGKAAVLELMSAGVGLYDAEVPLSVIPEAIGTDGDRVFVEMTITARTAAGRDYENHYVLVFTLAQGLIIRVHEYLDTLYAQRLLFDPAGQPSPLDES